VDSSNLGFDLEEIAENPDAYEISSSLGYFMGSNDDVLGIGIYNMVGTSVFSSAKDLAGDVGLTAFKSLLNMVGHQIEAILPAETSVQFIAPSDVLVGISKISSDKILAVILNRDAQISHLIPNIVKVAKLLQNLAKKSEYLSNDVCKEACEKVQTTKAHSSTRTNIVKKFGA
jgi:hypothetical protein